MNYITCQKLDKLNDKEILIFNEILKFRTHSQIQMLHKIPRSTVSTIINQIYKKLDCYPHNASYLRALWRNSLIYNETQKKKTKAVW